MKKKLMMLLGLLPAMAMGQSFDFDMTEAQPVYSDGVGYGYDLVPAPTKKTMLRLNSKTMSAVVMIFQLV